MVRVKRMSVSACAEKFCAWANVNFDVAHAATAFPSGAGGELVVVTGLDDGAAAVGVGDGESVAEVVTSVVGVSTEDGGG